MKAFKYLLMFLFCVAMIITCKQYDTNAQASAWYSYDNPNTGEYI
jgi:hypothetical protein